MSYVLLNGSAGTWIDSPDHSSFAVTDLDVRALVSLDDWTSGAVQRIVSQRAGASNRAWSFYVNGIGRLGLNWSSDGTGAVGGTFESSSAPGIDGTHLWIRATLDVDNGSGQHVVTFYTSTEPITTESDSVTWTQLSQHTGSGTTSIFNSTANLELGTVDAGGRMAGRFYFAALVASIGGVVVTHPDFRDTDQLTTPNTVWTDTLGRVYTLRGNATWVADTSTVTPARIGLTVNLPTPAAGSGSVVTPAAVAPMVSLPTPSPIGPGATSYVDLDGSAGTWLDTPDHANFAITGDIDIRMLVAPDVWNPGVTQRLIGQRAGTTNRAWDFSIGGTGTLGFGWSTDGTGGTGGFQASAVQAGGVNGTHLWLRVTMDVNDGAGNKVITFYTSTQAATTAPGSVTWVQLSQHTVAGTTSIFNSTHLMEIGTVDAGGLLNGRVYWAEVRNGIAGTVVTNPDFRDAAQKTGGNTFTDPQGRVWTMRGNATWVTSGTGGTAVLAPWRPLDFVVYFHRDSESVEFIIELPTFDFTAGSAGATVTAGGAGVSVPWRPADFIIDADRWTVTTEQEAEPPPPPPPLPVLTTEDILSAGALSIQVGLELLDLNDVVLADISDDLETGVVARNMNATIHGTARLRLSRALEWHNQRLRPYMVITELITGVFERFDLGIYLPETPSRSTGQIPFTYNVEAYDKLVILDHPHGIAFTAAQGAGVVATVESILDDRGLPHNIDQTSTATVPSARSWPLDEANTTLRIVNDLLASIGYRALYVDRMGVFRSELYRAPAERAPLWHYDASSPRTIIGAEITEEIDLFSIPNWWVFVRDDPAQEAPVEGNGVYTVVNNTDGISSISSRGRVITKVERLDAADHASLVAQGNQIVQRDRQPFAHLTFTAVPNPLHWHADSITVTSDELGLSNVVFGEQSWSLPLDGGDMTHEVRRSVAI